MIGKPENNMKEKVKTMKGIVIASVILLLGITVSAVSAQTIQVGNVEELYAAVNDPANAGATLVLAPGVYMLSATDPSGAARANAGRLQLQENMSLLGVEGDRGAVVIDANDLPASSYLAGVGTFRIGAIRIGRGSNSIESLTVRNARLGVANIDTSLHWPGTAFVRIANIASSGSQRGLDVINHGPLGASGETIEADIVGSDFFDNHVPACQGSPCAGVRVVNFRAASSTINVRMTGNRFWGQQMGRVFANNGTTNSTVSAFSSGNRAFGNGAGTVVLGANAPLVANGNSVDLQAHGDHIVDNTGTPLDATLVGGLVVVGGDTGATVPNTVNNNTVNVSLWGCLIEGNNVSDIYAVGARSWFAPTVLPGNNNHVTIVFRGERRGPYEPVGFFADSLPNDPSLDNSVTVIR